MKRRMAIFLVVLCLVLSVPVMVAGKDQTPAQAANGVVQVYAETTLSDGMVYAGVGSAFGVGKIGEETDIFITNRHVVTAANQDGSLTQSQRVYLMLEEDSYTTTVRAVESEGQLYTVDALPPIYDIQTERMVACDVLYISQDFDFAVLQARERVPGRVALELAAGAETLGVGQQVYALGFPALSDDVSTATGWEFSGNYFPNGNQQLPIYTYTQSYNSRVSDVTVTTGVVSRFTTMASEGDVQVIQHDATIHGGNSGGPLINSQGKVVGVNTYTANATESLNYAIYIDYVRQALDEMGIDYNVRSSWGWIAIVVVALAAVGAGVWFVLRKKGSGKPRAGAPVYRTPQPQTVPGDSGFRIQGVSGYFGGKRYAVNHVVRLGRDPQMNQLVYPQDVKGISRVHCELTVVGGKLYLKDAGSSYGTYLGGGQRLAANQAVELKPGDRFSLASQQETFVVDVKGGV